MHFILLPLRVILFGLIGFFLCRIGFYWINQDYFEPLSYSEIIAGFLTGSKFDSATIMLFTSPMIILLALPFSFIQSTVLKKILVWLCGFSLLITYFYTLADAVYFNEVKRHIGADILNLSADKNEIINMAFSSRLVETILGLLFLTVLLFIWHYLVIKPEKARKLLTKSFATRLLGFLSLALIYLILFRGLILTGRPIGLSDAFTGSQLQQANLALNPVYVSYRETLNRYQKQPLKYVSDEDLQNFEKNNPLVFKWQRENNQPTGKNIVLILLESWSYHYIDGLSGNHFGATPFMDSLVKKSQVWDNFYAAGQRSIVGIQAALSSLPALPNHSTIGFGLELNNMSRIAAIADSHHYRTVMMQSSARRSFHIDSVANVLGFKEYYGKEDIPVIKQYPQEVPPFGWDYDALQFLKNKLSEPQAEKKPFFAFLFTGSTHEPFPYAGKEFELYPHSSKGEQGFLNALRYSDWSLEQFMNDAAMQDWYKNTIFIFMADHTLNAVDKEGLAAKFHIPLVIFAPDGSLPAKKETTLASQYDLFPTMMDLLGFNQPIYTFGRSLFSDNPPPFLMLSQGNLVGMLSEQGGLEFNEQGIQQRSSENEQLDAQLKQLQLRMQYADKLLRENRWVNPSQ